MEIHRKVKGCTNESRRRITNPMWREGGPEYEPIGIRCTSKLVFCWDNLLRNLTVKKCGIS